jgi:TRAP-type C4-dicarboxylate transport system permease small subunit
VSITAGIPMTIPYAAFVTGFTLIAVAAVAGTVERPLDRVSGPALSSGR